MKKKYIGVIIAVIIVVCIVLAVFGINLLLSNWIDSTNAVCINQKFSSAQEAIEGMETEARENYDVSLDYCPPYKLMYSFDYEENTIVFFAYSRGWYDGEQYPDYAVRVLKHNDDGSLSFDGGFADFHLEEPDDVNNYYYFTNIRTADGMKSISFLYLHEESDKDIYVDGNKAEKRLVTIEDNTFYICYAISNRDTFLSNIFTPIAERHSVEVK